MREGPEPRRIEWRRRSGREKAIRIASGVTLVALGYLAGTFSLAQALVRGQPAMAYQLASYDGRVAGNYASVLSTLDASAQDRARADDLARFALRRDPTTVLAVSTLGLNASARNDAADASAYFSYAKRLSRREVRTQLWSIEDAVARESIDDALQWYDIALRVKPELDKLLFPILTTASSDENIQPKLVRVLSGNPAWGGGFLKFLAINSPDPILSAKMLERANRASIAIPQRARADVIDALARKNLYDSAWQYYKSSRTGEISTIIRDPRFMDWPEVPTQFDWNNVNNGDVTTSLARGQFSFYTPSNTGGTMLWQRLLLKSGVFTLSSRSEGLNQSVGTQPEWVITCNDGREIGRYTLPNSSEHNGSFSTDFNVPSGCSVQTLALVGRLSDIYGALSGQLTAVRITPKI